MNYPDKREIVWLNGKAVGEWVTYEERYEELATLTGYVRVKVQDYTKLFVPRECEGQS